MKENISYLAESLLKHPGYEIRARLAVLSWLAGVHPSAFKGQSVEFSEHRPYFPGDEVRYIDWRVTAKFEKVMLKTFEQSSGADVYVIVDNSGSMNWSSGKITKLEFTLLVAASILYIAAGQGDRTGMFYFSQSGELTEVRPSTGSAGFRRCASHIDAMPSAGDVSLDEYVIPILERLRQRSIVFFISDFFDFYRKETTLARFSEKYCDMRFIHVFDPAEVYFPFRDDAIFKGLEGEGEFEVSPRLIKKDYRKILSDFIQKVEGEVTKADGIYYQFLTNTPLDEVFDRIFNVEGMKRNV